MKALSPSLEIFINQFVSRIKRGHILWIIDKYLIKKVITQLWHNLVKLMRDDPVTLGKKDKGILTAPWPDKVRVRNSYQNHVRK